jgi:hypothetical protein
MTVIDRKRTDGDEVEDVLHPGRERERERERERGARQELGAGRAK